MKGVSKVFLLAVLAAATVFFGCTEDPDGYSVYVPKAHTVYTIARKGEFIKDQNFGVVLVYGFNNNREIARQISDFLNQGDPNTFFYFEED